MENVKRTRGRPPSLTDLDKKRRKAAHNSKLNEARIYLGGEIGRWNWLKERLQLKSHIEVAAVLLDCYFKHHPSFEPVKTTNQRPPSDHLLQSQVSPNYAVFGELDTRSSEITSVPGGNALKLEPPLSMTCDEYGNSSYTCNDQQYFDQTQVDARQLQRLQTTQSHLEDLPFSAISSSPNSLPLNLGAGASRNGTSSLVPGDGTSSNVPGDRASEHGTSSSVPATLTVIIKTEDGVEVDDTDTYGLSKDTCTEIEADSGNSGKENKSSAQCNKDISDFEPDCNELAQCQTSGIKRKYGKTQVEDSDSIKKLEKSSSLNKAQDAVEYKKRPKMVQVVDEIDDKNKRNSSRLQTKGYRIDYADYDELNDISDLESEGIESDSECLDNMLEESVEPVDGGSDDINSSLKPEESVDRPTDEGSNDSNLSIQPNENDNSVKASIGKQHIKEDPDFDPEEIYENKKRKKDFKKAPKSSNIPPAGSENELEDLPKVTDQFKTLDMMKQELEKRKTRIKVTLENHKDLFYEEEVVSLQRKDRAKCQEDKCTLLLVCAVCKKYKTGNKTGLEMHLEQHLNGDFDCDKCEEKFESSYSLRLHMSESHSLSAKRKKKTKNMNKFKCPECSLDFRISHSFRKHMDTAHGKITMPCKVCFEMYPTLRELREHTKQMHEETMAQCDICSDFFFSRKGLRSHRELCGKVDNVSCEICGKQMTPAGLKLHLKQVHENVRLHNCPSCSYTAKTPSRLRLHIKSLHTGEHTFKCDQCPFTCVQKVQLTSHMRTHTGEKPYKCDQCPYAAAWNVQMDTTTKSLKISAVKETEDEFGSKIHKCNECLYRTGRKSNLKRHMTMKHVKSEGAVASNTPMISLISATKACDDSSNNVGCVCDRCGKAFGTKYGFHLHVKNKHQQVFKYMCESCGKGYNQRAQFKSHCAGHKGVETDKCIYCGKTFSGYGSLLRHVKTCVDALGTNLDRLICNECGHTFPNKQTLGEHIRGKHEKPHYACEQCGKQFSWRSSLASHKKHAHRGLLTILSQSGT